MTRQTTYRAKWLLSDPWTILENGYVSVSGNRIIEVGSGRTPKDSLEIDLGSGVIMPPLVNAHTHLELSALKDVIPFDVGFLGWTRKLIQVRTGLTTAELLEAAENAVRHLEATGCVAVADISTLGITRRLLRNAPLVGVYFSEHLGNELPDHPELETTPALLSSLAAHAPHTTAPVLLQYIKHTTTAAGLPMSVHLSESDEELLFIQSGRGEWADFMTQRGIDFSGWPLPARSPVQYLQRMNLLGTGTLAVHLLQCSAADMETLRDTGTSVCFCPRSNFLLHGKLPDIAGFLALGSKPCLGTDSLASCPSLSMLDEMAFAFDNYQSISPADILAMGTLNGVAALGLENRYGRLAPGFIASPLYLDVDTGNASQVLPAVISHGSKKITVLNRKYKT